MDDDLNFFDQKGTENVVPLKSRKNSNWKSDWQTSSSKTPLPNLFNVMITLRQHPQLCNLVQYDEMARSAVLINQIPNTPLDKAIPHIVGDADVLAIQEEIQRCGLRRVAKATVQDGIMLRSIQECFHPVKQYLEGLTWARSAPVSSRLAAAEICQHCLAQDRG